MTALPSRAHRPAQLRGSSPGFTLLEVLLALTLSALVITLTGGIAVQTLRTERRVGEILTAQAKTGHIVASIAADLANRVSRPVKLTMDANHRPAIEMTSLAAYPGDSLHLPRLPSTVTYRLVRNHGNAEGIRLQRVVRDLTRSSPPPVITTVADDLAAFEVAVIERGPWQPLTATVAARLHEPRGLRIMYQFIGTNQEITKTLLIERPGAQEGHRGQR